MKKLLISAIASYSLLFSASVNLDYNNDSISYTTSGMTGLTIKDIFIYKNERYIGNGSGLSGVINSIDSGNYKVIYVVTDSTGNTQYIQGVKTVTTSVTNIAPSTSLNYSINGNTLNFSATNSDKDGSIKEQGFYIYDSTGKLIKTVTGTLGTLDLQDGKYQIISYVIDNNDEKTISSKFFEVKQSVPDLNTPNYTLGKQSAKYNKVSTDKEYYSLYSFHDKIGSWSAYEQGWTGAGVKVGILDSGIDYNHTDLNDNIIGVYSTLTYSQDAINGFDDYKHGTQVAGVIAAEKNSAGVMGVAYDADIISVKVLNNTGSGSFTNISKGAVIATDAGAKVTNLSAGGLYAMDTTTYKDGFLYAVSKDNSMIFAAGNDGKTCTNVNGSFSGCHFPGALPLIYPELLQQSGAWIVVGSVDKNGNMSSYSNKAGLLKDFFMVAPGGNISTAELIYTTAKGNSYSYTYGTSFAAPMVTGAFALLAQKYPFLKGSQIRDILFRTATDLGAVGVDDVYGQGALNITKAMQPIGTLNIKQTKFNVISNTTAVAGSSLVQSSSMNLNIADLKSVLAVDDYNRGFNLDMSSKAVENRYDIDDFNQFQVKNIIFGLNEEKQTVMLGYNFDYFSIKASVENNVFGAEGKGATELTGKTYYSTIETNLGIDGLKIGNTLGYSKPEVSGMFTDITEVYGLSQDVSYSFGNFTVGAKTPMRVIKGELTSNIPIVQASDTGDVLENTKTSSLRATTDYNVYVKYELKF